MGIEQYNLDFRIKFDDLEYECKETIEGKLGKQLKLDCVNLKVNSVKAKGKEIPFHLKKTVLTINGIDSNKLLIDFNGKISQESLMGIHQSKYDGGHIITTQMEPTGARSVFPCIDNPSEKAKFSIKVNVDKSVRVVSNTKPKKEEMKKGASCFEFEKTPKMSTYLIYLGIGKFEILKGKYKDRDISVITTPKKSTQGRFSLGLLKKLLGQYETYYGIKYPLKKLDLIAIPQFGAGAMENWGAITFREIAVLVNKSVSFMFKKNIGYVVSHELAHQWFGNLVTMKWWDDLWLNESFATFVGTKMLDRVEPSWKSWEDFLRTDTLISMREDALLSTHPIRAKVTNPDEISEIFDAISYGKGASTLRMIEQFLGEENFRKGVSSYLKAHSYANASGEDLWNSLSKSGKEDVSVIMKSWIEKGGLPLLSVERRGEDLFLKQHRFTFLGNNDKYLWKLPVFIEDTDGRKKLLMKKREMLLKGLGDSIVNPGGEGYYRVSYEGSLLDDVLSSDNPLEFKMKLIDDYYSLYLSGAVKNSDFMKVLKYVQKFDDYGIVLKTNQVLSEITEVVENEELSDFFVKFLRKKNKIYKEMKDENSKVVLEDLLTASALVDKTFRNRQKSKISRYGSLSAEERTSVLVSASIENYKIDQIWNMVKEPENDMESVKSLIAMAYHPNSKEVTKLLDYALAKTELRANLIYAMYYVTRNKNYRKDIWTWTAKNIDKVRAIYEGSSSVSSYIERLVSTSAIGHRNELNKFLKSSKIPEATRAIKKGLEMLEVYENLAKRLKKS